MNKQTEAFLLAEADIAGVVPGQRGVVVSASRPHESVHPYVAGTATYIGDIPELADTLHAALGTGARVHARTIDMDLDRVKVVSGVVAVFTSASTPGTNDCGPIIYDDPTLATDTVHFVGQPMFIVVATSHDAARRAARLGNIEYEVLPPLLTPEETRAAGKSVLPPTRLKRGEPAKRIAAAPHSEAGKMSLGGQEQFYLESQISYAVPKEDDGMHVWCSTQHPTEMQHMVSHMLDWHANQVLVKCRRMDGGFGGKESQSDLFTCCVSLVVWKLTCPVKPHPDHDDDTMITGKRHDFRLAYETDYDDDGRIQGVKVDMTSCAGLSADLSGPVMTCAICHLDSAYWLPEVEIDGFYARMNTQPNTAFHGFGGPQGVFAIEYIIDNIARSVGKDALDVCRANLYGRDKNNATPYEQTVKDDVIHELLDELEATSDYRARREVIRAFDTTNPVLRRGLVLMPVKFGISLNVKHFNQASALVHFYSDGSILANHGGTEMGQGLNTRVAQVVAYELGVSFMRVRVTAIDTSKVVNTPVTAVSTGSDLNGKTAQDATRQIRQRLIAFAVERYEAPIGTVAIAGDHLGIGMRRASFDELVGKAYVARVQLWSDGFYATLKLYWDQSKLKGRPFYYFAYGAAVSEMVVDTLTGEWRPLRADVLHDAGCSINPAIDIGQMESAFIQGMGWLTTEELWWNKNGKLMMYAPSTYKTPTVNDCPPDFRVNLFNNVNVEDSIHRSKALGEPPLLLPFSVFSAICDTVAAAGDGHTNPSLNAPATNKEILKAVDAIRNAPLSA